MAFPNNVRGAMGHALYLAQIGKKHERAKVLKGMGSASVLEVRENDRSGTYRIVYTLAINDFLYVLHAFQKKSTSGIATPKHEIDLIKKRIDEAKTLYNLGSVDEKNKTA
jgi:phage-related protein